MKPIDSKNIFDVVKKGYAANQPKKNGRIDPIYSLFDRDTPLPKCQELAFFTDTSICTGCKACEVACKQWNQLESDPYHWSGDSYDNTGDLSANNWRHVKFIERFPEKNEVDRPAPATLDALLKEPKAGKWLFMSDQCKHCRTLPRSLPDRRNCSKRIWRHLLPNRYLYGMRDVCRSMPVRCTRN
mgnify:CR=1 FL=1